MLCPLPPAKGPQDPCQHLVARKDGKPYTVHGFYAIWRRRILKCPVQFTLYDLRTKSLSDDESLERGAHGDTDTTSKYYRLKHEKVEALAGTILDSAFILDKAATQKR